MWSQNPPERSHPRNQSVVEEPFANVPVLHVFFPNPLANRILASYQRGSCKAGISALFGARPRWKPETRARRLSEIRLYGQSTGGRPTLFKYSLAAFSSLNVR